MSFFYDALPPDIGGIITGLVGGLIWAAIVLLWQIGKSRVIRRSIRRNFIGKRALVWRPPNMCILLTNTSGWPVTIRRAGFIAEGSAFDGRYLSDKEGNKEFVYDNHILLKTRTNGCWGVPIELLKSKIETVWVEYEFDTIFGRSRVEEVELGGDVAKFFEDFRLGTRRTLNI
jgi:hypothetical protein